MIKHIVGFILFVDTWPTYFLNISLFWKKRVLLVFREFFVLIGHILLINIRFFWVLDNLNEFLMIHLIFG